MLPDNVRLTLARRRFRRPAEPLTRDPLPSTPGRA
jgi:hypothetical protein